MTIIRLLFLLTLLMPALPVWSASYTFRSDSFAWESAANAISWDGTCTAYPGDDDKSTISFSGGFVFPFGGSNHGSVRVLSNGMLQFGADTGFFRNYTNSSLPAGSATARSGCTAGATTNVMMAYWTDLDPSRAGSGKVTWEQKGTAPNRYVVVSWNSVYQYNTSTPYAFQIILFENGEFKYQYGNSNATGSNATIGVQVSNSDYTLYAYNSGYNANGSAIRWFRPSGSPTRRAEYRFDEYAYSGRVGEVQDSTGNGNDGVRVGASASSVAGGYVCRGLSIAAEYTLSSHAVDTALDVSSGIGNSGAVSLWYKSNITWNSGMATLLDASTASARPFFLTRQGNGGLRFSVSDSAGTVLSAVTGALSTSANSWKHVAVAWRLAAGAGQSSVRIYIDGLQVAAASGTTNGIIDPSLGTLFIGDNRSGATPTNSSTNSANGVIDEMRVYNYEISAVELIADMAPTHACPPPLDHIEAIPASSTASTCSPLNVTIKACSDAACSSVMTGYVGTVNLSTSTAGGDWGLGSGPAPAGSLSNGTAGDGLASYTFAAADAGVARLTLSNSLAQTLSITAVDSLQPATSRTSGAIAFRDNAFVFAEDPLNRVDGALVAVAGRPHDLTLSYKRRDPTTGECGDAAAYSGNKTLKLWRTDSAGSWTAPTVVAPALTIPASQPGANNITLNFVSGVANLSLGSSDIGRYSLNVRDDNLTSASSAVVGSIGPLTVRPFVVMVLFVKYGATANPNGATASSAVFAPAGANFGATVAAYTWNAAMLTNGADPGNTGTPSATATETAMKAGNRANGFASDVSLSPKANSQTPTLALGGFMGALNNGLIAGSSFSAGVAATSSLQYTEVGSFELNTTGVVSNFLGSGLSLNAVVVNDAGNQNTRVGRFVPAGFVLSGASLTHRATAACAPASTFSYLGENFQFDFTLTAQNALGAKTANYHGDFARLNLAAPASLGLAGIEGSTLFKGAAIAPVSSSGNWVNGLAGDVKLIAAATRDPAAPSGPFANAQFGIAAADLDGVTMRTFDLDTDSPANGADRSHLGVVPLRYGRLRLQNGIGSQERVLRLPLLAQYWTGSGFATNTLDSCTRIRDTNLSFGNFRKGLAPADAVMQGSPLTLLNGEARLVLAAPAGARAGSYDVAIGLGPAAAQGQCSAPWVAPLKALTAGANMDFLRGPWCGANADKDPSARASFGLYRGNDSMVYQRENY